MLEVKQHLLNNVVTPTAVTEHKGATPRGPLSCGRRRVGQFQIGELPLPPPPPLPNFALEVFEGRTPAISLVIDENPAFIVSIPTSTNSKHAMHAAAAAANAAATPISWIGNYELCGLTALGPLLDLLVALTELLKVEPQLTIFLVCSRLQLLQSATSSRGHTREQTSQPNEGASRAQARRRGANRCSSLFFKPSCWRTASSRASESAADRRCAATSSASASSLA